MNILHLQNNINITCGVSKTIFNIIQYSDNIHSHQVLCIDGDAVQFFKENGIRIQKLKPSKFTFIYPLQFFFQIYKFSKINKIDVIHAHHRLFDIISFPVCYILKIISVTSVHSKVYGRRFISYNSKNIIAVSESIRAHLISYFHIPVENITLIHNFASLKEPEISSTKNELNLQNFKIILFAGRLSNEKGIDLLLEAFKKILSLRSDVFLLIVGNGEEENLVENFTKQNKSHSKRFTATNDISNYYKIADMVILPSRVDPFPLVMLEAGLMKKIFIGSNVDGIGEFIEDRVNGRLLIPGSIDSITEVVLNVLSNLKSHEIMADKLFEDVLTKCNKEKIIKQYMQTYEKLFTN